MAEVVVNVVVAVTVRDVVVMIVVVMGRGVVAKL